MSTEFINDNPETGMLAALDREAKEPESRKFYSIPKKHMVSSADAELGHWRGLQETISSVGRSDLSITRALKRSRLLKND